MFTDKLKIPLFASMKYSDFAARFGFFKEMGVFPEIYFDADETENIKIDNLREIAGAVSHAGMLVTVHAPFWDLSPGSTDHDIRKVSLKRMTAALNIANTLNAQNVVFHSGYNATSDLPRGRGEWLKNICDSIGSMLEYAKSFGISLAIENVYDESPVVIMQIVESFSKHDLNICFDAGHFNVFGRSPLEEWIDAFAPYLREVHLHSNFGRGDEHLALDDGNIDFDRLLGRMVEKRANPIITIENKKNELLARSVKMLRSERFFRMLNNFRAQYK